MRGKQLVKRCVSLPCSGSCHSQRGSAVQVEEATKGGAPAATPTQPLSDQAVREATGAVKPVAAIVPLKPLEKPDEDMFTVRILLIRLSSNS